MRVTITLLAIIAFSLANAQVNLSDWRVPLGTLEKSNHFGRESLLLNKGYAYLPASEFNEGVIEADISTHIMAGLIFRVDSLDNYEEVYIRFPKSGQPDALQYTPVYHGEFSWQFFPEYQARVIYPENEWTHLKIIIERKSACIYLLNDNKPALCIDSLRGNDKSGHIGLWSLAESHFSNLTYRDAKPEEKLPLIANKLVRNSNAIKNWWISEPFIHEDPPMTLTTEVSSLKWRRTSSDPDGYLNINQYARKKIWGMTRNNSNDMIWLRYEWEENRQGVKPFSFEYSNLCSIFLNNSKLFMGNNSFLLKGSLYRGEIDKQMKANTIFLPVKKGKNVLHVAVSGIANGWGFMGQFDTIKN